MKHLFTLILLLGLVVGSLSAQQTQQHSAEAVQLLQCLRMIEGQKTISGTMACVNWNLNEAKQIASEADRLSREVCPALLQHVIHS